VGPTRSRILAALIECYPESISRDELADRTGYHPRTGSYRDALAFFINLGIAERAGRGCVVASEALYLEEG
jgi:hypothetical protein